METTSIVSTEAYQQYKSRKARRARRALDFGHSPQAPYPAPPPTAQKGLYPGQQRPIATTGTINQYAIMESRANI